MGLFVVVYFTIKHFLEINNKARATVQALCFPFSFVVFHACVSFSHLTTMTLSGIWWSCMVLSFLRHYLVLPMNVLPDSHRLTPPHPHAATHIHAFTKLFLGLAREKVPCQLPGGSRESLKYLQLTGALTGPALSESVSSPPLCSLGSLALGFRSQR